MPEVIDPIPQKLVFVSAIKSWFNQIIFEASHLLILGNSSPIQSNLESRDDVDQVGRSWCVVMTERKFAVTHSWTFFLQLFLKRYNNDATHCFEILAVY